MRGLVCYAIVCCYATVCYAPFSSPVLRIGLKPIARTFPLPPALLAGASVNCLTPPGVSLFAIFQHYGTPQFAHLRKMDSLSAPCVLSRSSSPFLWGCRVGQQERGDRHVHHPGAPVPSTAQPPASLLCGVGEQERGDSRDGLGGLHFLPTFGRSS